MPEVRVLNDHELLDAAAIVHREEFAHTGVPFEAVLSQFQPESAKERSKLVALGAIDEGRIATVALARLASHQGSASILALATKPEYRRRGYAREVVSAIATEAKNKGVTLLKIVPERGYEPFCEKLGFVKANGSDASLSKIIATNGQISYES